MASSNSGVYQLRISVGKTCSILIGKLGNFTFPTGKYYIREERKKTCPRELIGIRNETRMLLAYRLPINGCECPIRGHSNHFR
jgi:hypothetical protein